jgi:hypothetical protein
VPVILRAAANAKGDLLLGQSRNAPQQVAFAKRKPSVVSR